MDKLGADVNWSALAADAFQAEVSRIKARRAALKGKIMDATVSRLQASKKQYVAGAAARGRIAGTRWAHESASFGELCALAQLDLDEFFKDFPGHPRSGFGYHEYLAFNIEGPIDHDRARAAEFWRKAIGTGRDDDLRSQDYLRGFVEGALEVFEAAEKKI
jgi:hypothetical protein